MVKKYVIIKELTTTTCHLTVFHKTEMDEKIGWNTYQTPLQNLGKYLGSSIKLRYSETVVDDLIENIDHICEVEIENGRIINVDPLMSFNELEAKLEAEYEGISESSTIDGDPLRMKIQKVVDVLSELDHESHAVEVEELFKVLKEDHDIVRNEAVKLLGVLMRDGRIYSPRPGYYKKTL